ncbi:hypothetical protein SBF1_7570006 [Candidatus Desulfosporosinus infrequens]|uniref:Uncharacterized protein n=1 Tax=Candidatus Desulfosporosinus infrequens TaxID=2043169 RepID=A0A2U3LRH0_9FIRM|nr:hypothetical protein SBF1_7570006 [Candidatus Desulfosporosinus infrequens]
MIFNNQVLNISRKVLSQNAVVINDYAAETPCHAINVTFYCHPSLSLRMTPK